MLCLKQSAQIIFNVFEILKILLYDSIRIYEAIRIETGKAHFHSSGGFFVTIEKWSRFPLIQIYIYIFISFFYSLSLFAAFSIAIMFTERVNKIATLSQHKTYKHALAFALYSLLSLSCSCLFEIRPSRSHF